ncbi:MAG: arylsulfatase A-like enzyme [Rhodothermales bacterium]
MRDIPRPKAHPFSGIAIRHEFDWGSLPEDLDYHDIKSMDYAVHALEQTHERPFFLALGLFRPHLPWYSPSEFFHNYPLSDITMPPRKEDDLNDIPKAGRAQVNSREFELIRKHKKYREAVQANLAAITFADSQVGRVLDALDASPYVRNTVIVLWSDHGWHLGSKNHWHKWTLWEEATRVPFIIAAPDQKQPGVPSASPVNLLDLFPTLTAVCDLPTPAGMDGIDLTPLVSDPSAERGRPVTIERERGQSAVRDARYRYIRYQDGSEELYDLSRDPNEWTNRAAAPELAATKARLAEFATREWRTSVPGKGAFTFDPKTYTWKRKKK